MSELNQEGRCLSLRTPLGPNTLAIQSFTMNEAISRLFSFQLEMLSEKQDIKPEQMVGQRVTLTIYQADDKSKKQFINGFVSRFFQGSQATRVRTYHAEVVPWLWYLTQCSNVRIFQKKTVPEIIEKVLRDRGFTDFQNKIQGKFEPREYCVQYRETDFAFISRLMEEEGIFYFFEHADDKHTLIMADVPSAHQPAPGFSKYSYVPKQGPQDAGGGVTDWRLSKGLRTGKYALKDYHFQMPNSSLLVNTPSAVKLADNQKLEHYDYPGGYAKRFDGDDKTAKIQPDGERTLKLRMQEVEAQHHEATGATNLPGMCTGRKFALEGSQDADGDYVVTQVRHWAQQSPSYFSNQTAPRPYENTFTCIPLAVPYRPARVTAKPIVHGVQTAVVVGLAGEEIDTDKYGRVKVQFHWDREGKKDENSSCWVRVATMWAGQQWGSICIPRIGQEVIVSFLEGDPDQPIIVGSVYNFNNMPPWELPKHKTQSGLVTRSTKSGDKETYNELCFEDEKGKELIYLRAERDLIRCAENDETIWVGHDRWADIENHETVKVHEGNREVTVDKGNQKHTLKKGNREAIIEMGNDALTIKMGNQATKLDLGKSETEAMLSIEFKVGQSSLKIDQTGVTIKGLMINVEGTAMTAVKGPLTQVQGSGMLQLSGGVMMLG